MASQHLVEPCVTTTAMKQRWAELVRVLADEAARSVPHSKADKGSLTVLGSGIMHPDLSVETEQQLLAADYVFYSINDHVTKSWVNTLRPDAYDLAVLYDERVERHTTYTRMAEALLHHVRRGQRVAAIFYGHPGVFAAPAHRAIHIARKEGHAANMRPGISALDCLIADIGFDPALPGILMYEATDMLLRRRRLDPTLHTVIWQVGVVGEFGYSRGGYRNRGLHALVDRLENAYGPNGIVTHYVGAQYVGVLPHIKQIPVATLRDPSIARELTTLSTFYIAPVEQADNEEDTARSFGAVAKPRYPTSDYTHYGAREISALRSFSDYSPAAGYEVIEPNAVIRLLTRLSRDVALRMSFERDPVAVLASPDCADLSEWEKRLLVTRHHKTVVAAINGASDPTRTQCSQTMPST
jgi:hypothetical protein